MNALGIFRKSAPPTPQWDDRDSSEKTRLGQRVSCKALVQGWGWTHRNWTDVTPITDLSVRKIPGHPAERCIHTVCVLCRPQSLHRSEI